MPKPIPFGFDDGPYTSPGFLLWRVSAAWQRSIRAALEPLGLTHAQFVFVATLAWHQTHARNQDSVTQAQLAQTIGMDVMTASQVARTLQGKGLLERRPKPGDGRAMTLELTSAGLEVARRSLPLVNAADATFFALLEGTPEFVAELRRLIGVT
jgi:MarR family transcriptional regulator, organic hydroperoxide resistance regulator